MTFCYQQADEAMLLLMPTSLAAPLALPWKRHEQSERDTCHGNSSGQNQHKQKAGTGAESVTRMTEQPLRVCVKNTCCTLASLAAPCSSKGGVYQQTAAMLEMSNPHHMCLPLPPQWHP